MIQKVFEPYNLLLCLFLTPFFSCDLEISFFFLSVEIPRAVPWQQNDSHPSGLAWRELSHHHVHLLLPLQLQRHRDQIHADVWPAVRRVCGKHGKHLAQLLRLFYNSPTHAQLLLLFISNLIGKNHFTAFSISYLKKLTDRWLFCFSFLWMLDKKRAWHIWIWKVIRVNCLCLCCLWMFTIQHIIDDNQKHWCLIVLLYKQRFI